MLEINKIYQGDCLKLMEEIPDESIDLIVTDTPYGINHKNQDWDKLDYDLLMQTFLPIAYNKLKEDRRLITYLPKKQLYRCKELFKNYKFDIAIQLKNFACYRQHLGYIDSWQPLLIIIKGKPAKHKKGGRNWFMINSNNTSKKNKNNPRNWHPAGKCVDAMKYLIEWCSNENDLILDPFIGSGTTALACLQTKRNFIGIEIEPKYVEIANKRINEFKKQLTLIK